MPSPDDKPATPSQDQQLTHESRTGITSGKTTGSGGIIEDVPKALKQISVAEDFKRLPEMPCARSSLMYGIASGAGIGAIRFMSAGPRKAANWAVGTFVLVSIAAREVCQRERAEEVGVMRQMMAKYPERHARAAKERAMTRKAESETAGNGTEVS